MANPWQTACNSDRLIETNQLPIHVREAYSPDRYKIMPDNKNGPYDGDVPLKYPRFRPDYPVELFKHLVSLTPNRALAWDCGTGTGQSARELAKHFESVIGTDESQGNIAVAEDKQRLDPEQPKVAYRHGSVEDSGLNARTVDLITSAQAVHQFELGKFYEEVQRVLRPGGVLAVWGYFLPSVDEAVDRAVCALFDDPAMRVHHPDWISHIKLGYKSLPIFLGKAWTSFEYTVTQNRTFEDMSCYIDTWYIALMARQAKDQKAAETLESGRQAIAKAWGERSTARCVSWRLFGQWVRTDDA